MATIGTFTRDKTGYAGAIRTLTLTVDIKARFVLNDARKSESALLGCDWRGRPTSAEVPRGHIGTAAAQAQLDKRGDLAVADHQMVEHSHVEESERLGKPPLHRS